MCSRQIIEESHHAAVTEDVKIHGLLGAADQLWKVDQASSEQVEDINLI